MTRALLLAALAAVIVWALVIFVPDWAACPSAAADKTSRTGTAEESVAEVASAAARPLAQTRHVGRPSPYWKLERRYVRQQHAMGRLGAQVRRLRREARAHQRTVRTLQARHEGDLPETFRFFGWAFGVCIHGKEGAWDDPNAPYWGGIQADEDFMKTWAPELYRLHGTADHWSPVAQIAMSILAWTERGFHPWPNTAAECGLL